MKDPKAYDHYAWFFAAPCVFIAIILLNYPMTTDVDVFTTMLNALVISGIMVANGYRKLAGKKTYFWRMLAVYLTALFALYVISSM